MLKLTPSPHKKKMQFRLLATAVSPLIRAGPSFKPHLQARAHSSLQISAAQGCGDEPGNESPQKVIVDGSMDERQELEQCGMSDPLQDSLLVVVFDVSRLQIASAKEASPSPLPSSRLGNAMPRHSTIEPFTSSFLRIPPTYHPLTILSFSSNSPQLICFASLLGIHTFPMSQTAR